jgi:ATP citrate (pro-S)-lyase
MNIQDIRNQSPKIVVQGLHPGVIQSILDYDHLLERDSPSIVGIIARGRKKERFFWGKSEIEIPLYGSLDAMPKTLRQEITAVVNVQSARNVRDSILEALGALPHLQIASVFAEGTPEVHALEIISESKNKDVLLVGPSSVGVLIPGSLKLGAIGGTMYEQLVEARIKAAGDVAVITTSGGMVNELIRVVTSRGRGVSFAIAMGGDRYPILDPSDAMLLAEQDPATAEIIYFGELGGVDEYKIIELIEQGRVKKRVVAYIAGVVAELFDTPPQFGHAKALAQSEDESATSKKDALRAAGVVVCDTFDEVAASINEAKVSPIPEETAYGERHKAYFMSHLSGEVDGVTQLLGRDLVATVESNTLASLVLSVVLGKQVESKKLIDFTDYVLRLLVDHTPNVSGAVNTIIAARAGKDLVSSLSAGLLTIGPRFGGAVNGAADAWVSGVESGKNPKELIREMTNLTGVIQGIGHKKYRLDNPDPRVEEIVKYAPSRSIYLDFAKSIEAITTTKKSNLILNVDGAIAAVLLDLLVEELHYTPDQLRELVNIEFFNSLFVISRTVGFTGHYLDQRRNDEGLFRLSSEDVSYFG